MFFKFRKKIILSIFLICFEEKKPFYVRVFILVFPIMLTYFGPNQTSLFFVVFSVEVLSETI